ncbi:hypothetical protein RIF29_41525 [Crotalaria pallida]|uniref:SCP domain-containing protein n=1 Tax=Crotalaria pallida TaxID=3830 RepID=A0AAN9EAQ9_CROPI
MGLRNVSLSQFFFCVLGLAIVSHVAYAQDSIQDYLNAHNVARAQVRVPNLVWSRAAAAFAQNYANKRKGDCNLIHSGGGGIYGENLAMSTGDLSGAEAVKLWVDEKPYYNYNIPIPKSCVGGEQCLHYSQVIWKNTRSVGCAKVRCDNGGTFITCNYYPPGNYVGQRPY